MQWSDVLNPDLSAEEILLNQVPAFHEARREQFRRFTTTDLVISVYFEDTGEKYTLTLGQDDVEAIRGEAVDFPQLTLTGFLSRWDRAIRLMSSIIEPMDAQIERYEGRVEIHEQLKANFERFDGVFEVTVIDLPDGPPLSFKAILNDYEAPPRAREVQIEIPWDAIVKLACGDINPIEAAREIKVSGAVGLALEVGGFLEKELNLA